MALAYHHSLLYECNCSFRRISGGGPRRTATRGAQREGPAPHAGKTLSRKQAGLRRALAKMLRARLEVQGVTEGHPPITVAGPSGCYYGHRRGHGNHRHHWLRDHRLHARDVVSWYRVLSWRGLLLPIPAPNRFLYPFDISFAARSSSTASSASIPCAGPIPPCKRSL